MLPMCISHFTTHFTQALPLLEDVSVMYTTSHAGYIPWPSACVRLRRFRIADLGGRSLSEPLPDSISWCAA